MISNALFPIFAPLKITRHAGKFTPTANVLVAINNVMIPRLNAFSMISRSSLMIPEWWYKIPNGINIEEIKEHLLKVKDVKDVHHIHVWSIDGRNNYATMHVVASTENIKCLKCEIKSELREHGIAHTTIEFEKEDEKCGETECHVEHESHAHHHHH